MESDCEDRLTVGVMPGLQTCALCVHCEKTNRKWHEWSSQHWECGQVMNHFLV